MKTEYEEIWYLLKTEEGYLDCYIDEGIYGDDNFSFTDDVDQAYKFYDYVDVPKYLGCGLKNVEDVCAYLNGHVVKVVKKTTIQTKEYKIDDIKTLKKRRISMSGFTSSKKVKTRKEHICYGCERNYPKGSTMEYYSGLWEDHFFRHYVCKSCENLIQEDEHLRYILEDGFIFGFIKEYVEDQGVELPPMKGHVEI